MNKNTRQRDWTKAQPHDAKTGKIRSREFAGAHPEKVEWVTAKRKHDK